MTIESAGPSQGREGSPYERWRTTNDLADVMAAAAVPVLGDEAPLGGALRTNVYSAIVRIRGTRELTSIQRNDIHGHPFFYDPIDQKIIVEDTIDAWVVHKKRNFNPPLTKEQIDAWVAGARTLIKSTKHVTTR